MSAFCCCQEVKPKSAKPHGRRVMPEIPESIRDVQLKEAEPASSQSSALLFEKPM
jgi:hypothetical protein